MIYREEHNENYTQITNKLIRSEELSAGAFRLLIYMLSCNDGWAFSIKGLAHQLNWPERTIQRLVNELKKKGHIVQTINFDERGKFLPASWDVYEDGEHGLRVSRKASATQSVNDAKRESRKASPTQSVKSAPLRKNNSKERTIVKKEQSIKEDKTPLGEFQNVFLTSEEKGKLITRLGAETTEKYIQALGDYLQTHPKKKYASHYRTILTWSDRDGAKKPEKIPQKEIDWSEVLKMAEKEAGSDA